MSDMSNSPLIPPEDGELRCPSCRSFNIEENDPVLGEHTCRDCGEWIESREGAELN